MADFGSKDFSTLDRNAAIVNDVLKTRLQYEAVKAEREKTRYQEQAAADAINQLSEVYKQTHNEEKWVPTPDGKMKKESVEVEGPDDAELFRATNEAVARAQRLGAPGQKAQEAARDMLNRWTQRRQAKEQFPQSSVDKYEFYLQAAGGDPVKARELMQRDAMGVAQAQPYATVDVETAEGVKRYQFNKATGRYGEPEVVGGLTPRDSTAGGGSGGGQNQITLDTGREKITLKGKTQQDIQSQVRDNKQSIQPDVMGMTQRTYKIDPDDLDETFGELAKSEDGLYYPALDMTGISKQDPKALKDAKIIERILAQEYIGQGMLPEAGYAKAKAEMDKVFKWAAYDRAEANREAMGFGQGPAALPSTGGPTQPGAVVATVEPKAVTAPRADGKIKVQVVGSNPPKIGWILPNAFNEKKYVRI